MLFFVSPKRQFKLKKAPSHYEKRYNLVRLRRTYHENLYCCGVKIKVSVEVPSLDFTLNSLGVAPSKILNHWSLPSSYNLSAFLVCFISPFVKLS